MMSSTIRPLPPAGSPPPPGLPEAGWAATCRCIHSGYSVKRGSFLSAGSRSKSRRAPAPEIMGQKIRALFPNNWTTSSYAVWRVAIFGE
jgi:hypothetical protein